MRERRVREQHHGREGEEPGLFTAELDESGRPPRGAQERGQRHPRHEHAHRDRGGRACECSVHAETEKNEGNAEHEPGARLHDQHASHPSETRESLKEPEREGQHSGEEQAHAKERHG